MNQQDFGKELARIRKTKGLTQFELAEMCNVSSRTIQRIETGIVTPRSFTIKALSIALDFDFLKEFPITHSKNAQFVSHRFFLSSWVNEKLVELFNLKKNTMKKLSILAITSGLVVFTFLAFFNKSNAQDDSKLTNFLTIEVTEKISQKEAIETIDNINKKVQYHNESIDLIKTYAEESNFNYNTYVHLAKLISSFGHSSAPIMEIAKIVFSTNMDCNLFNDIASLIFLNTGYNNNTFIELAKDASMAKGENEKNNIRIKIEKYKNNAKYKTLNEAFENQY
jgi:transcriptional regulator with XRE-family HTH domain